MDAHPRLAGGDAHRHGDAVARAGSRVTASLLQAAAAPRGLTARPGHPAWIDPGCDRRNGADRGRELDGAAPRSGRLSCAAARTRGTRRSPLVASALARLRAGRSRRPSVVALASDRATSSGGSRADAAALVLQRCADAAAAVLGLASSGLGRPDRRRQLASSGSHGAGQIGSSARPYLVALRLPARRVHRVPPPRHASTGCTLA